MWLGVPPLLDEIRLKFWTNKNNSKYRFPFSCVCQVEVLPILLPSLRRNAALQKWICTHCSIFFLSPCEENFAVDNGLFSSFSYIANLDWDAWEGQQKQWKTKKYAKHIIVYFILCNLFHGHCCGIDIRWFNIILN